MSRKRLLSLVSVITVLIAGTLPASAAPRFFGFVPRSAKPVVGVSGATGLLGVSVPDTQQSATNPGFNIGFMLPEDYKRNSVLKVAIYAVAAEADCGDIVLDSKSVLRSRPGTGIKAIPQDAGTFEPDDGSPVLSGSVDEGGVVEKLYRIRRGPGVSLRSGDALTVAFERDVLSPDDTCAATVFVTGVRVEYRSE